MAKEKKQNKQFNPVKTLKNFGLEIWNYITFFGLLFAYILASVSSSISNSRVFPQSVNKRISPFFSKYYNKVISFSRHSDVTINRVNLIDLSIKNMRAKLSRTFITVGGMAVGIGAIVLLESIGYGLQELVISRVARLEELKQVNVSPQQGNNIKITDESLASFKNLTEVFDTLPQISLVGRVSYQGSNTDVAVYGVTSDYLKQSAIQPTTGDLFESNDTVVSQEDTSVGVEEANTTETSYIDDQQTLAQSNSGVVLAEEDTIDVSELDPTAQTQEADNVNYVDLPSFATKQAVVNRSFLRVLNIPENEAVGKSFSTTFVVVGSLLDSPDQKTETLPGDYTIVGVTSEDDAPFFYVPFIDLRGIGISNYSQVKVVVENQEVLTSARRKIEAMGFITTSVVDTVSQIDSLFSTLRILLAIVGLVAVTIAALGMFNTLTVSLLERTREVGFMKALGMKSHEIRDLFLTESLLMGIFGGLFGLLFGYVSGLGVNLLLSLVSWSQGGEYIDITYIPSELFTVVVILSLVVGIFTGYYPAKRATSISALNALRYE